MKIHFIGAEGVSMKALAAIAVQLGFSVTGSDLVTGGHDKNNITGKDLVVYSGAVPEDNEELAYAKKNRRSHNGAVRLFGVCGASV